MSSPASSSALAPASPAPAPQQRTTAAQITSLSSIDREIAELLASASSAIRCLSTAPSSPSALPEGEFTQHAEKYHALLSSITVKLRRQIYALQAAEIPVSAGTAIDVGVLNSRNDVVGREMEGECWNAARTFLEGLEGGKEEADVDRMEVDS